MPSMFAVVYLAISLIGLVLLVLVINTAYVRFTANQKECCQRAA